MATGSWCAFAAMTKFTVGRIEFGPKEKPSPFPRADDVCARCGHRCDSHGRWYGVPEDGCSWNDERGVCSCADFTPDAKPNRKRKPKSLEKKRLERGALVGKEWIVP
jgi:hypothetical protein